MALVLDVYEELTFLGSLGVEGEKLVYEGPEKEYLTSLVKDFFPNLPAEEVVREFAKKFTGVTHCRPHGNPNVHEPD